MTWLFIFLFIVGMVLTAASNKQVRVAGVAFMVFAAACLSAIILFGLIPILLLAAFPLILAYAIYKVLT